MKWTIKYDDGVWVPKIIEKTFCSDQGYDVHTVLHHGMLIKHDSGNQWIAEDKLISVGFDKEEQDEST